MGVTFDEMHTLQDLDDLLAVFRSMKHPRGEVIKSKNFEEYEKYQYETLPKDLKRTSEFLGEPQFAMKFSETNMMRYTQRLCGKDLSLTDSMISLGSCTMKLNPAVTMIPVTWTGFCNLHPFVPPEQCMGFHQMIHEIEDNLVAITHYDGVSMQPASGATGEYAGLNAIRMYHKSRGEANRNICLIPTSAHGTNPATATLVGMKVIPVPNTNEGFIDIEVLRKLVE